jgi:predicted Zn-dependent protease
MIAVMLGHALIATDDQTKFPEAKQVLKNAVNRDNDNPFAWYQLGIVYDREGDRARANLATAERQNLEGETKLALAAARSAMMELKMGTPDYLRAQDIAMVSETQLKKDKKHKRDDGK